mgnify:CR=1 FL=1
MNRIFENPFGKLFMTWLPPVLVILAIVVGSSLQYGFSLTTLLLALSLYLLAPYLFGACKNRNFKYPIKQYLGHFGVLTAMVTIAITLAMLVGKLI